MKSAIDSLKEYLRYEPETGLFFWLKSPNKKIGVGQIAGTTDNKGYYILRLNRKGYKAHRVAWAFTHGKWPEKDIDHINRVRNDCRISNLRQADKSQNGANSTVTQTHSGYRGVYRGLSGFNVQVMYRGKSHFIGSFPTKELAKEAYEKARKELHGVYAP